MKALRVIGKVLLWLLAVILVLVLVAPQLARDWFTALVLVGLVVAGIEVVRGIVQRESHQPT